MDVTNFVEWVFVCCGIIKVVVVMHKCYFIVNSTNVLNCSENRDKCVANCSKTPTRCDEINLNG